MGLISITLPTIGDPNASEDADIRDALQKIRDEINGLLDNANIKNTAGITHSKLANAAAGQLLIANASGVITPTSSSGDVTINSSGVLTIGTDKITNAKMATDSVGALEIIADSVGTSEIAPNAVTAAEIAPDAVGTTEIATSAVASDELAAGSVIPSKYGIIHSARVWRNTSFSALTGVGTPVEFNVEKFNVGGLFNPVNPTRLTAPVTGIYHISGCVRWSNTSSDTGQRRLYIQESGAGLIIVSRKDGSGSSDSVFPLLEQTVSTLWHLTAGQYVELYISQASGATRAIETIDAFSPEFAMKYEGPIA